MKLGTVKWPALVADLAHRAERLATVRLVQYVAEFGLRGSPTLSIRQVAETCRCDKTTAGRAITEAVTNGWVDVRESKNSAAYTLGPGWIKSSEKIGQSDNGGYAHSVRLYQTLSHNDGSVEQTKVLKTSEKIGQFPGSAPHPTQKLSDKVGRFEQADVQTVRKNRTVAASDLPGGDDRANMMNAGAPACDSPYPLPLIGSSRIGSLRAEEESCSFAAVEPVEPIAPVAPKKSKRIDAELREEFERWWPLYPKRVGKRRALEIWLRQMRIEHVPDVTQAVLLFGQRMAGKDPEFIQHPSTWLLNGRWRDEFENVTELASMPAPKESGNGRPTLADRNADSRREFLSAFGIGTTPVDRQDGGRGHQLLGPAGPALSRGVLPDDDLVGAHPATDPD